MNTVQNHLRVNDKVEIIAGKDKGRVGKILKIYAKTNKALVENANMMKKHLKPTPNQAGQILEKEAPIHISNLMLVCPHCTKTVRVGSNVLDDGNKARVCKQCKEAIEPAKA